jgi:hypothetical protein
MRHIRHYILISTGLTFLVAIGTGAAIADLPPEPEPAGLVGATFVLRYPGGGVIDCSGVYFRGDLVARGREVSISKFSNHPELNGRLTLRQVVTSKNGRAVAGEIFATLRTDTGEILYRGNGTIAGGLDNQGGISYRGLLRSTLYSNGAPTDRELVANIAYRSDPEEGKLWGGFGAGAGDVPSWSVETNGKTCPPS